MKSYNKISLFWKYLLWVRGDEDLIVDGFGEMADILWGIDYK
jgi:hypothetical protein